MARIEVMNNYGGVSTDYQRILPGVYEHDDAKLFGLAAYLVENGHAREVDELPDEPEQLENMTRSMLEIKARALSVGDDALAKAKNKAAVIALIREAESDENA